jgi:hypothetical protein
MKAFKQDVGVMEGHGAYIKVTLSSTLRVMARIK